MNLLLIAAAYRDAADEAERRAHRAAYHKDEAAQECEVVEKRRCKAIADQLADLYDREMVAFP